VVSELVPLNLQSKMQQLIKAAMKQ